MNLFLLLQLENFSFNIYTKHVPWIPKQITATSRWLHRYSSEKKSNFSINADIPVYHVYR